MPDAINEAAKMILEKLTQDSSLLRSVISNADIAGIAAKALTGNPKFAEVIKKIADKALAQIESGDSDIDVESTIVNACDEEKITELIKYNPAIQESLNASLSKFISGKIDDALEGDGDIDDNIKNALVPSEEKISEFITKDEIVQLKLKEKIIALILEKIEELDSDTENNDGNSLGVIIEEQMVGHAEMIKNLMSNDPDLQKALKEKIKAIALEKINDDDNDDYDDDGEDSLETLIENEIKIDAKTVKELIAADPEIQAAKKEKLKKMILQDLSGDDDADETLQAAIRKELHFDDLLKEILSNQNEIKNLMSSGVSAMVKGWINNLERDGYVAKIVGQLCAESSTVKGLVDRAVYSANTGKLEKFVNDLIEQIFKGKSQALTDKIAAQLSEKLGAEIAKRL
ncbi:MAG: hypothetical protein V1928_05725 [Parcubacteria group bacterium]